MDKGAPENEDQLATNIHINTIIGSVNCQVKLGPSGFTLLPQSFYFSVKICGFPRKMGKSYMKTTFFHILCYLATNIPHYLKLAAFGHKFHQTTPL